MGMKEVGEYIQGCRKDADLTQENVADKLSVSRGSVQNWERGSEVPEGASLIRLCALIGADIREVQRLYLDKQRGPQPSWPETRADVDQIVNETAKDDDRQIAAKALELLDHVLGRGRSPAERRGE